MMLVKIHVMRCCGFVFVFALIIIAENLEHKNYRHSTLPVVPNFFYVKKESLGWEKGSSHCRLHPFGNLLTKFLVYEWALQIKYYLFYCSDFHFLATF